MSSKRKAVPASAVSSSSAEAAAVESSESDRPQKKQELAPPEVTSSVSCAPAVKAEASQSSSIKLGTVTSPVVKAEVSQPSDELILEWVNYDGDGQEKEHSISADKLIAEGISLRETIALKLNEKCEWDERYYTLKLVDKTKTKKEEVGECSGGSNSNEIANLNFTWWADSSHANLMNFNQKSQDLADFCSVLWSAAGRKRNQYCDMAIEFGNSPHSCVEVNDLIAGAFSSFDYETCETTYLDVDRYRGGCATYEQGLRLINGLISLIGQTSTLITHGSDLDRLNIDYFSACTRQDLGFQTLKKGRGQSEWYVRTANYGE